MKRFEKQLLTYIKLYEVISFYIRREFTEILAECLGHRRQLPI